MGSEPTVTSSVARCPCDAARGIVCIAHSGTIGSAESTAPRKRDDLLARIVALMSKRGERADYTLSDIQDELSMAGYDVPLRGYQTCDACFAAGSAARCPEHVEALAAAAQDTVRLDWLEENGGRISGPADDSPRFVIWGDTDAQDVQGETLREAIDNAMDAARAAGGE